MGTNLRLFSFAHAAIGLLLLSNIVRHYRDGCSWFVLPYGLAVGEQSQLARL